MSNIGKIEWKQTQIVKQDSHIIVQKTFCRVVLVTVVNSHGSQALSQVRKATLNNTILTSLVLLSFQFALRVNGS